MFLTKRPPPTAGSVLHPLLLLPLPDQDSVSVPSQRQDWGVRHPGQWADYNIDWCKNLTVTHASFLSPPRRKLSSTCWRRSAGFCRPPTKTSASLWSASLARQCWTQSWATPHRRQSAPFCTSAKGRRFLWKVSQQNRLLATNTLHCLVNIWLYFCVW